MRSTRAVLSELVEADLEKIGVPLGHRKRLLKAIAALGDRGTRRQAAEPARSASSPTAAERRPITVMFCDLVGSTSLAAKLDAEDWRTLVNAYLDEASAAVTGLGGHVLKKLGDGLMALFGYPHAQENDAERAVRAALAIQRALVEINAMNASKGAPELSARIGLDSGQVVVEATGEVFGDAPNIAARVQSAAEPGSILITADRPTADCRTVRGGGPRPTPAQGGVGADDALSRRARERRRPARRGARSNPPRRSRGGARSSRPALGARAQRRGPTRADRRRARPGQVETDGGVSRPPRRDAAHLDRMVVVAAVAEYALAPDRRMGPPALRRGPARRPALGRSREYSGSDRPRPSRIRASARASGRCPLAGGSRRETRARGIAPPATGGDDGLGSGVRADASGRARLRGPALGRPDFARCHARAGRARGAGAVADHRDGAAGVPAALEREVAP